jgi:hypothetical protein
MSRCSIWEGHLRELQWEYLAHPHHSLAAWSRLTLPIGAATSPPPRELQGHGIRQPAGLLLHHRLVGWPCEGGPSLLHAASAPKRHREVWRNQGLEGDTVYRCHLRGHLIGLRSSETYLVLDAALEGFAESLTGYTRYRFSRGV